MCPCCVRPRGGYLGYFASLTNGQTSYVLQLLPLMDGWRPAPFYFHFSTLLNHRPPLSSPPPSIWHQEFHYKAGSGTTTMEARERPIPNYVLLLISRRRKEDFLSTADMKENGDVCVCKEGFSHRGEFYMPACGEF